MPKKSITLLYFALLLSIDVSFAQINLSQEFIINYLFPGNTNNYPNDMNDSRFSLSSHSNSKAQEFFRYWRNNKMNEVKPYIQTEDGIKSIEYDYKALQTPCNNWLSLPSYQSYVSAGDLDVPGNKITIEATINRTQSYSSGTGNNNEGDIVSKHFAPSDINYLLRPNHAYITTTNGFFATPDVCPIELNKAYHVAMVYDGTMLKFYRNGFLMSQVAASCNLFQNDYPTRIGLYTGAITDFF